MTTTTTSGAATRIVSEFVSAFESADVPEAIRSASTASVVQVIGDVVGGSRDIAVDRTSNAPLECGLDGDIAVLG